jgi:hypothetical protein
MFGCAVILPTLLAAAASQIAFPAKPSKPAEPKAEIVFLDKVWDRSGHQAFTDLIHFRGRWFLTFREATSHVSPDGTIRVLTSSDFQHWQEAARLTHPDGDLRDPKLSEAPDGQLMLTTALALRQPAEARHQTFAWFSRDGREWGTPTAIGDPNVWLWRVQWHHGKALSLGYGTSQHRFIRAYMSRNGSDFETINPTVLEADFPNENTILFQADETALCLLRREAGSKTSWLGRSKPPYRAWTWTDLGVQIGGPNMLRIPDGRIVAAVRLYDGKPRTSLCWLDPATDRLLEFLALPSGGDTSYAGLAFYDGLLHMSYYSSHEGVTSIYAAKVKLPAKQR